MTSVSTTPFINDHLWDIARHAQNTAPNGSSLLKYNAGLMLITLQGEMEAFNTGKHTPALGSALTTLNSMLEAGSNPKKGKAYRTATRVTLGDACHPLKALEDYCVEQLVSDAHASRDEIPVLRQHFRAAIISYQEAVAARTAHAEEMAAQLGKFLKKSGVEKNDVAPLQVQLKTDLVDGRLLPEESRKLCGALQEKGIVMEETIEAHMLYRGLTLHHGKRTQHLDTEFKLPGSR